MTRKLTKLVYLFIPITFLLLIFVESVLSQNLEIIGKAALPANENGEVIDYAGNYAYVGCMNTALIIYDLSNPTVPTLISRINDHLDIEDLATSQNKVYLSYADGHVRITDVSNPYLPQLMGIYDMNNEYGSHNHHIAVTKNLLFQAHCYSAKIINITNPWNPIFVSEFDSSGYVNIPGIAVSGNFVYTVHNLDFYASLEIWDYSNPFEPDSIGSFSDNGGFHWNIVVSDGYAYISEYQTKVSIIDVTNPSNPVLADTFSTPNWGMGIAVSNQKLFLAKHDLLVYDVSNPSDPVYQDSYIQPTTQGISDICVNYPLIYAISNDSLYVFQFGTAAIGDGHLKSDSNLLIMAAPNPFNTSTSISFSLANSDYVNLYIYNLLGQNVAYLLDAFQQSGEHRLVWDAQNLPSGIYFATLKIGEKSTRLKLILIK